MRCFGPFSLFVRRNSTQNSVFHRGIQMDGTCLFRPFITCATWMPPVERSPIPPPAVRGSVPARRAGGAPAVTGGARRRRGGRAPAFLADADRCPLRGPGMVESQSQVLADPVLSSIAVAAPHRGPWQACARRFVGNRVWSVRHRSKVAAESLGCRYTPSKTAAGTTPLPRELAPRTTNDDRGFRL